MTAPVNNTVLVLASGCTYWLTTSTGGLPTVTNEVTINGHGDWIKRSYAEGTSSFSIFTVDSTVETTGDLILKSVNVANGGGSDTYDGGAIDIDSAYACPSVSVYGGTFRDNSTEEYGGAISNKCTLTVNGATFTNNSSTNGGAISSYGNTDSASLNGDTFTGNYASEDGGAIYNNDNDMTVTSDVFRYNQATYGGAIYNNYDLTINHSQFGKNSASDEGGALYNEDSATVNHSLMQFNRATDGGGAIYNDDTITLSVDLINLNAPDNCEPINTIAGCVG